MSFTRLRAKNSRETTARETTARDYEDDSPVCESKTDKPIS